MTKSEFFVWTDFLGLKFRTYTLDIFAGNWSTGDADDLKPQMIRLYAQLSERYDGRFSVCVVGD